jgi:hypothetical protein
VCGGLNGDDPHARLGGDQSLSDEAAMTLTVVTLEAQQRHYPAVHQFTDVLKCHLGRLTGEESAESLTARMLATPKRRPIVPRIAELTMVDIANPDTR